MTCVSLQENVASNWGWGWRLLAAVWTNRFTEEHHHTSAICLWTGGNLEKSHNLLSLNWEDIFCPNWGNFLYLSSHRPWNLHNGCFVASEKQEGIKDANWTWKGIFEYKFKVTFTTTKTYHLQLLQKCGAGTTGPVSVKSYLEVTLISTWQIFSLSWRRGLSAWGSVSAHLFWIVSHS